MLDPVSPSVSIVVLVCNRREKLRIALDHTLLRSDYPADRLDVIVVDNASTDGTPGMVRSEFPSVTLIERGRNVGVSGWNDGFEAARGDYVLALDDDCYLPPDGLRRAVEAAEAHQADLVSFTIEAADVPGHLFNDDYVTGLLAYWGCAVLMRRRVLDGLGGYDPGIFLWGNELEFMIRFFDHGFRHLYLPEVVATHMKMPMHIDEWMSYGYRVNLGHFAYIAARLLDSRDAGAVFASVLATAMQDTFRMHRGAVFAPPHIIRGFVRGLRRRQAVTNPTVSRVYRHNMHSFAAPWRVAGERRAQFIAARRRFYPRERATLQLGGDVTPLPRVTAAAARSPRRTA